MARLPEAMRVVGVDHMGDWIICAIEIDLSGFTVGVDTIEWEREGFPLDFADSLPDAMRVDASEAEAELAAWDEILHPKR